MKISDIILGVCFFWLIFCVFMISRSYALENVDRFKDVQFYPRTQIECLNPVKTTVMGFSMQPFLYAGDSVYLDPVNFSDINLGDVIYYHKNNKSVMHSVVAIYPDYLITAGYNNFDRDKYRVYAENISYRYCQKLI